MKNRPQPFSFASRTMRTFLLFLIFISNSSLIHAQEEVKATYNFENETLTIKNNTTLSIRFRRGDHNLPLSFFTRARYIDGKSGLLNSDANQRDIMEGNYTTLESFMEKSELPAHNVIYFYYFDENATSDLLDEKYNIKDSVVIVFENEESESPLSSNMENSENSENSTIHSLLSGWMPYAIAVIIILVIIILILNRKKKKVKKEENNETNSLTVVMEEKENFDVGLKHVRKDIDNYYVIHMNQVFEDTAIQTILISRSAIKGIYDFFKHFLEIPERTNETGCYLIGCWEYANPEKTSYNISLEYIIEPGDDAIYGEYNLNFGKKIGVKLANTINDLSQKTHREYVHNCWMHSHPGLGIFLSNYDLKVQQQLAYPEDKNRMVAIVIDTNTPHWDMVFFTPKLNGEMNNKDDIKLFHSLDELYKWSRDGSGTISTSKTDKTEEHSYYTPEGQPADNFKISFSGKAINEMDDILYSSSEGVSGYFFSESIPHRQVVKIDSCYTESGNGAVGCLIFDTNSSFETIRERYLKTTHCFGFLIIYCSDEEIRIARKNSKGIFSMDENEKISLTDLKAWMRRKRA
ncbi:hypothetical protein LJC68_00160 [Bacteroidales bacterium OttesenSCG-928-B11]|nr:hypothetical protein [Bacteroidales bacterium OttesenSCG-928-E04]MDL2308413.1 hypothetical protein [Bacteroidales bacterium OttesenSCG-928-C03]MDL2311277.1 hypothetical protein [Bacteroidales bacterium OttesenSCG-928-B11]MDL2326851.1 hypothetical protein [Bacteroidales bacterium OttesenSCG-928-A14]